MFDNMNMGNLGEMFNEMQKKAQELQGENESKVYTAKSGGGMVEVKANGKGEIIDIEIDGSLLEDKDALQILLISGINEVLKNVDHGRQEMAMSMLGGMNPFAK